MRTSRNLKTIGAGGLVALALLLAAGAAQGQTVVLDDNDNVIQILDLPVSDQNGFVTVYDVLFLDTTAEELYGPELMFDFPNAGDNGPLAALAAMAALNDESPVPIAAGPGGSDQFFVGGTVEQLGTVGVYGGEFFENGDPPNVPPMNWGPCDNEPPGLVCVLGVRAFPVDEVATYAQFTESGGPPAPTIDFTADPANIELGGTSTLSWSVTDADSCDGSLGSGGWAGVKDPVSGSEDVSPMVTSDFVLTCNGAGGQSESQLTVTVPEPGAALSMVAAFAALGLVGRARGKRAKGCP